MAKFSEAFQETMGVEGGYANNKLDTGGETYKGISRKHNPKWKGWPIIDAIKPHTATEINKQYKSSPQLQEYVRAFYKTNYWDINRLSELVDQQLANNVYDFGVNAGTARAAKFLQQAYNLVSTCDISVDGIIGNKTITAVNLMAPKPLYEAYNVLKKQHYDNIIKNNPSQVVFKKSWYSRIKPYKV